MVAYHLVIRKKALEFINALPPKSQRIVIERCKTLAEDPLPGHGDIELIHRKGHDDIYRLHIPRSNTAFYRVYKNGKMVKILEITTIEQAHKIYGQF